MIGTTTEVGTEEMTMEAGETSLIVGMMIVEMAEAVTIMGPGVTMMIGEILTIAETSSVEMKAGGRGAAETTTTETGEMILEMAVTGEQAMIEIETTGEMMIETAVTGEQAMIEIETTGGRMIEMDVAGEAMIEIAMTGGTVMFRPHQAAAAAGWIVKSHVKSQDMMTGVMTATRSNLHRRQSQLLQQVKLHQRSASQSGAKENLMRWLPQVSLTGSEISSKMDQKFLLASERCRYHNNTCQEFLDGTVQSSRRFKRSPIPILNLTKLSKTQGSAGPLSPA